MNFSINHFFSKCDQILRFLRIWSHLLRKCLIKNFIFCALKIPLIDILQNEINNFFAIPKQFFLPIAMLLLPNVGQTNTWCILTPQYIYTYKQDLKHKYKTLKVN